MARRRSRAREERSEHDRLLLGMAHELDAEGDTDRAGFIRELVAATSCTAVDWLRVRRWLRETSRLQPDDDSGADGAGYGPEWEAWRLAVDEHTRRWILAMATGAYDSGPRPTPPGGAVHRFADHPSGPDGTAHGGR